MGGEGGLCCGPSPTCLGLGAGPLPVGGHGLPGERQQPAGVCVCVCVLRWIHPASGTAELSLEGRGAGGRLSGAGVPSWGPGGWERGPQAPTVRRGPR